jgi:transcriptional regulator
LRKQEISIPFERQKTIRQQIISLLDGNALTAKDISGDIRISEKEVYEHLEHIQKTVNKAEHRFSIQPAVCRKCGFTFRKRDRLRKPGKCPVCRSETIQEPLFSITGP